MRTRTRPFRRAITVAVIPALLLLGSHSRGMHGIFGLALVAGVILAQVIYARIPPSKARIGLGDHQTYVPDFTA